MTKVSRPSSIAYSNPNTKNITVAFNAYCFPYMGNQDSVGLSETEKRHFSEFLKDLNLFVPAMHLCSKMLVTYCPFLKPLRHFSESDVQLLKMYKISLFDKRHCDNFIPFS